MYIPYASLALSSKVNKLLNSPLCLPDSHLSRYCELLPLQNNPFPVPFKNSLSVPCANLVELLERVFCKLLYFLPCLWGHKSTFDEKVPGSKPWPARCRHRRWWAGSRRPRRCRSCTPRRGARSRQQFVRRRLFDLFDRCLRSFDAICPKVEIPDKPSATENYPLGNLVD